MNKWKVAFFVLVGLIISGMAVIVFLATSPSEDMPIPSEKVSKTNGSVLTVGMTPNDFEKLAKKYLSKELNNSSFPIDIVVNDQIELNSEMIAFGVSVPVSMKFEPVVSEEGNIHLKQTEVNVGKLNIPQTTVLKLMRDAVEFPQWIIIRPNNKEIFVDLSNLKVGSNSKVRAKNIDLKNDRIILEVTVPNK